MRDRQRVRDSALLLKDPVAPIEKRRSQSPRASKAPKAAETAVKNDDLFKACFAHATIGFSLTDLDGRILEVNAAYCAITGYSEAELRSKFELHTLTHPADLPSNLEKMKALKAGEIPAFVIEKRYIRKDRTVIWVQNSVSLIRDDAGRPTHIVRLTQNINEHKLTQVSLREVRTRNRAILANVETAERKYVEIFENAGEGIFQSTPAGCYLTANPALARIHGFDSPEELIQSCNDISREIYVDPACREEFKRLIEVHGVVREFEHQTFRKDGRKIWISVNARAEGRRRKSSLLRRDGAGYLGAQAGRAGSARKRRALPRTV
jgi:PAS domain S-box-containing protein